MNQWHQIFKHFGIRKGSRLYSEYEAAKRIIWRMDLTGRQYDEAIKSAAEYVRV